MNKLCEANGCDRTSADGRLKRGYCAKHYQRFMKFGDPLAGEAKYETAAEALKGRSIRKGECLEWTGSKNGKGYGRIRINDRLEMVHRVAFEMTGTPIPEGMEVDHTCFNRACIEPKHLRLANRAQNTQYRRGAQPNSKTGIRNVHHNNGKWYVRLKVQQKNRVWGPFETVDEAKAEASRRRSEFFGGVS